MDKSGSTLLAEWAKAYRYPENYRALHYVEYDLQIPKEERWALGDLLDKRRCLKDYREPVFRALTAVITLQSNRPVHKFVLFEAFSSAHKIYHTLNENEKNSLKYQCFDIQQAAVRALRGGRPINLAGAITGSMAAINMDTNPQPKSKPKLKLVVDNTNTENK